MSYRLCLIFSTFSLTACGRMVPVPTPGNEPQPASDARIEVSDRERIADLPRTTLTPNDEVRRYSTTSTATIQLAPDPDSSQGIIRMTLDFSVAYSRILPLRTKITGVLTQASLEAEGLSQVPDQGPALPLEFTGHIESGGLFLDSLAGSPVGTVADCQVAGLNLITSIQRAVVVPPLVLSAGATWTDSSTVPACSGSVQLALTAIRTYTVAGETRRGGHPVIVVDRRDRVQATGDGAQGQHRITISSQGSGSARLYLDRTTGFLQESRSTQTIDLFIGSSGRNQRFRQTVEEQTQLQR